MSDESGASEAAASAQQPEGRAARAEEPQPGSAAAGDGASTKQSDPFSKAPRGDSPGRGSDAYRRGKQSFRVGRDGATISDSSFRDMVFDASVTNVFLAGALRLAPGPVHDDDMVRLRGWYAEVPGYDDLLRRLTERRVILLHGADGSGRSTTALHLLDAVSGGRAARLDALGATEFDPTQLEAGRGYLLELAADAAASFTQTHLDRIRSGLAGRPAWCILVVGHDMVPADAAADYVASYQPPDAQQVLHRHVRWTARGAESALADRLLRIAAEPGVRAALGSRPTPGEVSALANLLYEHASLGSTDAEVGAAVIATCRRFPEHVVADWFRIMRVPRSGEQRDRLLRLAGFRIALAALDGTTYHIVAAQGEQLGEHLIRKTYPHRTPNRPVFGTEHRWWLEASRGRLEDGYHEIGQTKVPAQLAGFHDERMPVAVLAHVWQQHHNARAPVLTWLREVVDDPREFVWERAALTVGLLAGLDFAYVFDVVIGSWARDGSERHKIAAAIALEQAAETGPLRPAVEETIGRWRDSDDEDLKWTAAIAFGRKLGRADVESHLRDLAALGTWPGDDKDTPLRDVACDSVAALLARGEVRPVVGHIVRWLGKPQRRLQDLALVSILYAASYTVADAHNLRESGSAEARRGTVPPAGDRRSWPLLLALQVDDPGLTGPFADLIWHVVDTVRSRQAALEVLTHWIRRGERDSAYLRAVAQFLLQLADTPTSAARLCDLIVRLRDRWERPLRADVADYLTRILAQTADGVSA